MNFNCAAFDEATRLELEKIARRGTNCFGEPLHGYSHGPSYSKILKVLAETPMRVRQIAVRLQARRQAVQEACEDLLRSGQLCRDEEHFYSLNPLPHVVTH